VALAICAGMGITFVIANLRSWELEDAEAYWNAALRLRAGGELYVAVPVGADEMLAYRYAPWLAWLWVPLTFLPKPAVQVAWSVALLGGVAISLVPLVRARTVAAWCLFFLLGGLLLRTASTGNVHALVIAALVWGTPRASGPLWIGLAASLKIAPILYALVYLGRRQWARFGLTLAVAGVLWLPALLYGVDDYPTDPGISYSLLSLVGPIAWVVVAAAAAVVAIRIARTKFSWLGASVAALAAIPRLAFYDLTYLLVWRDGAEEREPNR
jgi:hypothetical protein